MLYKKSPMLSGFYSEGEPPKGYKPLTPKQRQDWNNFIRYLNRDLKVGGSKELDDRSNSKGVLYLQQYRKMNPDFEITPQMVPYVQYEIQQLKDKNELPDVKPQGRVKYLIADYLKDRQLSDTDGWIGSLTSKQAYPEISEFSDDPKKTRWGLDYAGASDYEFKNWSKRGMGDKKSKEIYTKTF